MLVPVLGPQLSRGGENILMSDIRLHETMSGYSFHPFPHPPNFGHHGTVHQSHLDPFPVLWNPFPSLIFSLSGRQTSHSSAYFALSTGSLLGLRVRHPFPFSKPHTNSSTFPPLKSPTVVMRRAGLIESRRAAHPRIDPTAYKLSLYLMTFEDAYGPDSGAACFTECRGLHGAGAREGRSGLWPSPRHLQRPTARDGSCGLAASRFL